MQLSWQFNLSTGVDEAAEASATAAPIVDGKVCVACGLVVPLDEFCVKSALAGGLNTKCKTCVRRIEDLRIYGIGYGELVARYGTVCNICGGEETVVDSRTRRRHRLAIDHDHRHCLTGCPECIRGLLCRTCNYKLGVLEARPDWTRKAADYLGLDSSWVVG